MKRGIKEFPKIDGNTTSYSIHGIKAKARIRVEKDVNIVWKNLKLKKLGQPFDEVLFTTDKRFKHYIANEDRFILKHGLLFRKYYGETSNKKKYQTLIPNQPVDEVLRSLHGDFGEHPRITKTIIAYRQKNYYPNMAKLIRQWVTSCEQCIRESRVDDSLTVGLNYNTSYHTSIGCEPSIVFHGRVLYNVLDIKMDMGPLRIPTSNSQIAEDVLKQTELIFHDNRKNTMQVYIKYKE